MKIYFFNKVFSFRGKIEGQNIDSLIEVLFQEPSKEEWKDKTINNFGIKPKVTKHNFLIIYYIINFIILILIYYPIELWF